ncbi:MAG: CopD family protein, partial [Chloroflexota bacterium]
WFAVIADWLHTLAVGFWAGGVAALALVVPVALHPYTGDARRQALLAALRRFSRLAGAGLVVVIATGVYSALNWLTTPADLGSSYGIALIVKLVLVALLVGVGAAHHAALNPARYQRWEAVIARVNHFIPTLRLEALLVLAVLVAVGLLSATPIPKPQLVAQSAPPPSATQEADGYTITTTITPGGPGVNTYDVQIEQGGAPVEGLAVTLRMVEPGRDLRSEWHSLESIGSGLYASVGDEISRPGEWWTLLQIEGESPIRAAFDWQISTDAAVISSRPPTLLNLLALVGVVAALVYAAYPLLVRFTHWLNWSPASMTVALGATAVGIAVVILGVVLIQQSGEQLDLSSHPLPQIVNAVLPTGASLARGQAIYQSACALWLDTSDFSELLRRLPRLRDEELYAAVTTDGWWSLLRCEGAYTEAEWWDVVNYLRSLEAVRS